METGESCTFTVESDFSTSAFASLYFIASAVPMYFVVVVEPVIKVKGPLFPALLYLCARL